MEEQPNHELLNELVEGKLQEVIKTSPAVSVSVNNYADGTAQENIYPISTSSDVIADSTIADSDITLGPDEREKFLQGIKEVQGLYVSKLTCNFGFDPATHTFGGSFNIERSPKKTIKTYIEQKSNKK